MTSSEANSVALPLGAPDRRPPLERLVRKDDLARSLGPFLRGAFGALDGLAVFDRDGVRYVHVGEVWAESILGVGTTFLFTLPIAERS